jgi:hypothetical protein
VKSFGSLATVALRSIARFSLPTIQITAMVAVLTLSVRPLDALAISCFVTPNRYAHGYTTQQQWNGLYVQYRTWQPTVHSLSQDFTDSHVFMQRPVIDQCTGSSQQIPPWIEAGVFRGTLGGFMTSGAEYFDAWGSAADCIQVRPQKGASTYFTWNSYELVYDSTDNYGHIYWDALINGTRIEQIRNDDLGKYVGTQFVPDAIALSGGEATDQCYYQQPPGCTPTTPLNHVRTAAQQAQLQSQAVPWSTWNATLMTQTGDSMNTCADPSVTLTYSNNWYTYFADGDITS